MLKRSKQKNPSYSYFAAGVSLEGSLRFQGVIRLDGAVTGQIYAPGTLVALETSVVKGDIYVENLSLSGTVHGNIMATKLVHLEVSAKVYGNISYGELSIEVGALHEGSSHKLTAEEIEDLNRILNPPQLMEGQNVENGRLLPEAGADDLAGKGGESPISLEKAR